MLPARLRHRGSQGTLPDVLDQFQRDFDTIVEQFFEPSLERGWTPTGVEIWEDDEKVHMVAELPGMKAEDIDITIENNVLTIRGEKKERREYEKGEEKEREPRWHLRSRSYGQFMRQFQPAWQCG